VKREESHRKFNVASLVSLVLAIFTLVLWLLTFAVTPWDHRISFTKNFHVSVWSGFSSDTLGRLVVFNNAQYGPYRGSTMGIGGPNTHEVRQGWHTANYDSGFGQITYIGERGEVVDRVRACTLPGIYFRHFLVHDQPLPLWTLMVSFWYPLFLFSVLPTVWIFRRWRSRRS
jgi:hypothetical protein